MTNTVFKKTAVAVALVAAGVALGWGVSQSRTASGHAPGVSTASTETTKADRKVLYWYDPMSPTQKFDKPGKSPTWTWPWYPSMRMRILRKAPA